MIRSENFTKEELKDILSFRNRQDFRKTYGRNATTGELIGFWQSKREVRVEGTMRLVRSGNGIKAAIGAQGNNARNVQALRG